MLVSRRNVALGAAALAGAALSPVSPFAAPRRLALEDVLRGRLAGEGVFTDPRDGSSHAVTVSIRGVWNARAATLAMTREIASADGRTERRAWRFRRVRAGLYRVTGDDVVGEAWARESGGIVRVTCLARTPTPAGPSWTVRVDDRLTLLSAGEATAETALSWRYFEVGRLSLSLRRAA
ncbi:DUF3833 domain-containing protein [Alsobacter sp. SYSU M60028]|uniref:DUF3833 domain-containing protein n=1 Tax=Alsobacter ponti TaxID=2962936 RepID=A0ABT1LGS1_9HYPH|nr:DUF3833 family protein [Alsobacter ponti]MCP8940702.1 DUF3833 domain-containing protein [Alsobacter ponti]